MVLSFGPGNVASLAEWNHADVNPRNRTSFCPGDQNPADRTGDMRISKLGTSGDFEGLFHHAVFVH
jgi:hypothetical protein